jgi:putative flippase GtrA
MLETEVLWVKRLFQKQALRYLLNGGVATAVHFGVLTFNLKILHWESAGLSNFVAAIVGTVTSFFGNRYFVFYGSLEPLFKQVYRFALVYLIIAVGHGLILYVWTDIFKLTYVAGFILATIFQVASSFFGNKLMVFKA